MKRCAFLLIIVLSLIAPAVFAGGASETEETETTRAGGSASGRSTGVAVGREFEALNTHTGELSTVRIEEFNEAPDLAAMVEAGDLPPVDERLPDEPMVIVPLESVGRYGGTIVEARFSLSDSLNTQPPYVHYEFLVSYNTPEQDTIVPNVAERWEVSNGGRTYTFYLREGMKWSDGHPFTADDILFWYEDVWQNTELYPTPIQMQIMSAGGEVAEVSKIDDYTVVFDFPKPPGPSFLTGMARMRPVPYQPKHYMRQFHPAYTSRDEIERMMAEEKFDTWPAFFWSKAKWGGQNPDCPTIAAWVYDNHPTEQTLRWSRNPYYWKTDTEGNQLPYVDKWELPAIDSPEARLLSALAGDLSITQLYYAGGIKEYATLKQNESRGGFTVYDRHDPADIGGGSTGTIYFNFIHEDPVLRQLHNDVRFRRAISLGIDRDDVNELVYLGLAGTDRQFCLKDEAPIPGDDPIFTRYMQRDVERANELLDEIGIISERDSEGFRLRPDGKRLTIAVDIYQPYSHIIDIGERYKVHLEELGIEIVNKQVSGAVWFDNLANGRNDWSVVNSTIGDPGTLLTRGQLVPSGGTSFRTAPYWGLWLHTDGEQGSEPPEPVKELREIWLEASQATENEEQFLALVKRAYEIHTENQYMIHGICEPKDKIGAYAFDEDMRNLHVPGMGLDSWRYTMPFAIVYFDE